VLAVAWGTDYQTVRCGLRVEFWPCGFEQVNGIGETDADSPGVAVVMPDLLSQVRPRNGARRFRGEAPSVKKQNYVLHLRLLL